MAPRLTDYIERAGEGFKAMFALEASLKAGPLEPQLLHLVKLRASQINGCAYCIQMHTAEALKDGEAPLRLHMLPAWKDSTLYSQRERAALAWTDALTLVAETGAPDADWALVEDSFTPDERAWLSLAVGAINLWNRVQVGFRAPHLTDLPMPRAAHAA